ncbi:MAG: hypothetical protein ACFB10_22915 [Salibacteraceae bacterium]
MLKNLNEIPNAELIEMRAKFRTLAKSAKIESASRENRLSNRLERQDEDATVLSHLEAAVADAKGIRDDLVSGGYSDSVDKQDKAIEEAETRLKDYLSSSSAISNENAYVEQGAVDEASYMSQYWTDLVAAIDAILVD